MRPEFWQLLRVALVCALYAFVVVQILCFMGGR